MGAPWSALLLAINLKIVKVCDAIGFGPQSHFAGRGESGILYLEELLAQCTQRLLWNAVLHSIGPGGRAIACQCDTIVARAEAAEDGLQWELTDMA
jgi:hypothetical protein